MLQNMYDRKYVCRKIDAAIENINNRYPNCWSRQDQLLADAAEVQILLGNDKSAHELLVQCFAGGTIVAEWEDAAEETKNYYI